MHVLQQPMSWSLWQTGGMSVLAINAGSSSIRFADFAVDAGVARLRGGKIDRIGHGNAQLTVDAPAGAAATRVAVDGSSFSAALDGLMKWFAAQEWIGEIEAVGHRVVHGMEHTAPERATRELLEKLKRLGSLDPEHIPQEIEIAETFGARFPKIPQILCFDTEFHRDLPTRSKLLPIPRRYFSAGIRRYGFHGLSYTYLMQELARLGDPCALRGRVILAHLGSGASLAAVRDGRCIDTTMGFTPTGGLMMGTRSGDLDPGVLLYLAGEQGMSVADLRHMLNHESGLMGVSELSADVRDLLDRERADSHAAEAIELFCHLAKKAVASFAGALGGLDALVFTGGIGENSPQIRARICLDLGFLGIALSESRNAQNAPLISDEQGSTVGVRVIRTDEEWVIARLAARVLGMGGKTS